MPAETLCGEFMLKHCVYIMCSVCARICAPLLAQFVLPHKLHYVLALSWKIDSNMCSVSVGTWVFMCSICDPLLAQFV